MPRPCDHPTGPPQPANCGVCAAYVRDERYRAKWDAVPQPNGKRVQLNQLPCVHLGADTGERRDCVACGGRKGVPIHGCVLHSTCSPTGRLVYNGERYGETVEVRNCLTCADHSLADLIVPVDPPRPPGHESRAAFNCSLLDLPDGRTLFAYRCGWKGARIAMCGLDHAHRPGQSWLLQTPTRTLRDHAGQEDPRLFLHNGELYCSYIGVQSWATGLSTHQCLMRLSPDGRRVTWSGYLDYPGRQEWEKNWQFISHGNQLYAVYSINPHRVLRLDGDKATLIHESPGPDPKRGDQLRGGASPVLHNGEWYSWFHGKLPKKGGNEYWLGLVTYSADPPFLPLRYVRSKLLEPNRADRPSPTVPHAVFPCGAALRGSKWVVSYGYYDHLCKIAEFDATRVETWLEGVQ